MPRYVVWATPSTERRDHPNLEGRTILAEGPIPEGYTEAQAHEYAMTIHDQHRDPDNPTAVRYAVLGYGGDYQTNYAG